MRNGDCGMRNLKLITAARIAQRAKSMASVCIYSLLKIKDFMYNDLKEFYSKATFLDLVEIQGGSLDEIQTNNNQSQSDGRRTLYPGITHSSGHSGGDDSRWYDKGTDSQSISRSRG